MRTNELAAAALTWTDELPEIKGAYWWAPTPEDVEDCILVEVHVITQTQPVRRRLVEARRLQELPEGWRFPRHWTALDQALGVWFPAPQP